MTCPKCGNEVPEGKKFCGKCGTKLEASLVTNITNKAGNVCSKCGAELTPGKKFCGKCGTPVVAQSTEDDAEVVMSAGFVHWNILPGQLAAKIDEQDLASYRDVKGFVVQDGIKALFFADGALVGELPGGKYPFKDVGVEKEKKGLRRITANIAAFLRGKQANALPDAASVIIVLMRDAEFPMVFVEEDMPTAGLRSDVAVHIMAKITNIIQFYKEQLIDKKIVSFEKLADTIRPFVRTIIEENVTGVDSTTISANAQVRERILDSLKINVNGVFPYISVEKIIRVTASNEELDELRRMQEELYISEKELEELTKRNNFLNRLNDEKLQQQLREAQTQADFVVAMNKIDEQNQLTEDEKAKFADMLYWQRRLREATSKDEGENALHKLELNGLLRAEELEVLKSDIEQRKKLKDLSDGQALAMLTLQNNMALDKQKLQWEIEIGNERIRNTIERQRMQDSYDDERQRTQDSYADERRKAEMAMDKEEQLTQLELLRQAQAIRQEREDAEHKRKMEEAAAARSHEQTMTEMEQKHEEEMRRMFQNMSAEQIMAANPDISEAAANALAEKFKSQNAQAQVDMANKHSEDIQRIMQENAAQQNATMQQMMQMMGTMFAGQQARKDAEIADIRNDANAHQDRMENIIKAQATAAYGAAGKIYAREPEKEKPVTNNNRKDAFVCPNCGAEIEEGASFCGECGNSL